MKKIAVFKTNTNLGINLKPSIDYKEKWTRHMFNKQGIQNLIVVVILTLVPSMAFAFGEKPDYSEQETTKLEKVLGLGDSQAGGPGSPVPQPIQTPSSQSPRLSAVGGETVSENVFLSDEEIEARRKLKRALKQKQFTKLKTIIETIPGEAQSPQDRMMLEKLQLFTDIEALEKDEASLFKKDESMGEEVIKTVRRLYKAGQSAYLEGKNDLAKDLLIQSLFKDRKNFKSKKLLALGLGLPLGSYKVENVEERYWKSSLVNIYSGYPARAVDDLKVLEVFDPTNPEIFKRMGSSYYSMGEPKEAMQAWKRALYFEPNNKDLEEFIKNAKKEVARQDKLAKAQLNRKTDKKVSKGPKVEMQVLRITSDSNVAYSYAQEVRKQLPGKKVVVEEQANGKWAVMIPKK